MLLLVQIEPETIYYLELHEYFSTHEGLIKKLKGQTTITLRIPTGNVIRDNGRELIHLAKRQFKYSKDVITIVD